MRKTMTFLTAMALLASLTGAASAAKVKETPVWEDVAGDAGAANQGQAIPGAEQAGVDLVSGKIATAGKNLKFTVETSSTTPDGKFFPEGVRLMWHFAVGSEQWRFTVKSFDVGKPDVIAGGVGQERVGKVYANGVVRLEQCGEEATPAVTLVQCVTSVYTEPTFDAEAHTISWEIPLSAVKAKKGSQILGGTGGAADTGCQVCFVPHIIERSLTPSSVIDNAVVTGIHKV
ncbi:MAG: hypothetical protein M3161_01700 [Actinomycetota bacterium]|nr:hypothetical protein [Actinomycetota bacterium]